MNSAHGGFVLVMMLKISFFYDSKNTMTVIRTTPLDHKVPNVPALWLRSVKPATPPMRSGQFRCNCEKILCKIRLNPELNRLEIVQKLKPI